MQKYLVAFVLCSASTCYGQNGFLEVSNVHVDVNGRVVVRGYGEYWIGETVTGLLHYEDGGSGDCFGTMDESGDFEITLPTHPLFDLDTLIYVRIEYGGPVIGTQAWEGYLFYYENEDGNIQVEVW